MNLLTQQYHKLRLLMFCLLSVASGSVIAENRADVRTGLDVLEGEAFLRLEGKRVGLITNRTGINREGKSNVELFLGSKVKLVALFSPEHGLFSDVERSVDSSIDPRTGLPIFSLYGETRRPTKAMLEGIDVLVFDIQDVGVRFYTYITTMAYAMEEAGKAGISFMVLDRPNPINGLKVEGPVLDRERLSFTGYFPLPVRHGMTVGELAGLFNQENRLGANLEVVKMQGWQRSYWFDDIALPWVSPSPNIRNLRQATLYPAIGLLESTNLSVGRGTETPFEVLGAPWIKASRLTNSLNNRKIPGVEFRPFHFIPDSDRYALKQCHGIQIAVTDRNLFQPVTCGLEIAKVLCQLYPRQFQSEKLLNLVGAEDIVQRLRRHRPTAEIRKAYQFHLDDFLGLRRQYLLYQ
jgi:uncharacterized protein YbbC (DUF1343 family)